MDWSSALVEGGTLSVDLTGSSSKAWRARFQNVLALLDTPHHRWGEVRVVKGGIRVAAVERGSETDLRHFLESVVLEANSDFEDAGPEPGIEDDREVQQDQEMTAAFRAFSQPRG